MTGAVANGCDCRCGARGRGREVAAYLGPVVRETALHGPVTGDVAFFGSVARETAQLGELAS
jgi:hypothetical protein